MNGVVEVDGVKDEAETGATDDSAKEGKILSITLYDLYLYF